MIPTRCDHGMVPEYCADCRGLRDLDTLTDGIVITNRYNAAQFTQKCALNSTHTIYVGSQFALAHTGDGDRIGYICNRCTREEDGR